MYLYSMLRKNKKGDVVNMIAYTVHATHWGVTTVSKYFMKYPELKAQVEEILFKHDQSMTMQIKQIMQDRRDINFYNRFRIKK